MEINKNKINSALTFLKESEVENFDKMKNKLKQRLLLEDTEEENLELDALAQQEENSENNDELESELNDVETEEEENDEYIDVTGGISQQGENFVVQTDAKVVLAPGNKIKFTVGDEEFKALVGEPTDEEGILSVEIEEEDLEEIPNEGEDSSLEGEDSSLEGETLDGENEEDLDESIIEEIILEAEEDLEEIPNEGEDSSLEGEDSSLEGETLDGENEENLDEIPMNLGSTSEISSSEGGSNFGNEEEELGEIPSEVGTDLEQIVDTDELVNELIGQEEENPLDLQLADHLNEEILDEEIENIVNEVLKESVKENPAYKKATNEQKPSTNLGDTDITGKVNPSTDNSKVSGVNKAKVNPIAKQTDVQSKKLKTEEPKGTVAQTKATKEKPADITSKVKDKGDAHIDPKDDYVSKLKQDSATKSKALVKLAEDLQRTQKELKAIRLENYKLLKVNGLLTLLPELEQTTRETLCEKFDRCSDERQILSLYKKISTIVKESRKPSLNEMVTNQRKDVQSFSANKEHDLRTLKETVNKVQNNKDEEISAEQRRKNHLMGLDDDEGYYKNLN